MTESALRTVMNIDLLGPDVGMHSVFPSDISKMCVRAYDIYREDLKARKVHVLHTIKAYRDSCNGHSDTSYVTGRRDRVMDVHNPMSGIVFLLKESNDFLTFLLITLNNLTLIYI
jgi:hypothetical protein